MHVTDTSMDIVIKFLQYRLYKIYANREKSLLGWYSYFSRLIFLKQISKFLVT